MCYAPDRDLRRTTHPLIHTEARPTSTGKPTAPIRSFADARIGEAVRLLEDDVQQTLSRAEADDDRGRDGFQRRHTKSPDQILRRAQAQASKILNRTHGILHSVQPREARTP